MIKSPGRQPTRSEILLLMPLLKLRQGESAIIHHITEDTNSKLQLEVEFRRKIWSDDDRIVMIRFQRIYL